MTESSARSGPRSISTRCARQRAPRSARCVAPGRAARGREGRRLRARRGRDRSRGRVEAGATCSASRSSKKASSCARPGSTRRSSCSRSRSPAAATTRRRARAHARRLHRGRDRRAGEGGRRAGRATPLAVHLKVDTGMHRVGCRTDEAVDARAAGRRPHPSSSSRACARTSPSPTSPTTRTPPSSSPGSTPCSPRSRAADRRPASCTRRTPRARSRSPRPRYDLVRVGIGVYGIAPAPELARSRRAAAGAVGEGAGLAREAASRRRRGLVRAALRDRAAGQRSRPCRSATPTACRANLAAARRRGARARPPAARSRAR